MHNSSDIFCLKDVKVGENDGSQIFSVNGKCSMRRSKSRNYQPTDSFRYGSFKESDEVETQKASSEDQPATNEEIVLLKEEAQNSEEAHFIDHSSREIYDSFVEDMKNDLGEDCAQNFLEQRKMEEINSNKQTLDLGGDSTQNVLEQRKMLAKNNTASPKKLKNKPIFKKLNDKLTDTVSLSQMSRNPLTGAGMEVEEVRNQRKGMRNKNAKWEW